MISGTKQLERGMMILIYAILIAAAIVTLVPFVWLVCASLKTPEVYFKYQFLPLGDGFLGIDWKNVTFGNFKDLFTSKEFSFGRNVLNSIFYSSCTAVLATLFAAMGGYALAKFDFRFRNAITFLVLSSLIVPGALLIAPGYQLLYNLHLLDSFAGLILPSIAPAFGVFLFRQSMINSVPTDLMEAARVDGCGELRLFFTIILPIVRPMTGAFLLITFLGCWNNFIGPQVILQTPEKFPLAVAIAQLKGLYSTNYGMLMAGTLVSIVPVLALFLLLQKEFIAGLTAGAVKG
ncbi:MAG: arabinooligosaccharide transport system permease protein [Verrucomicrobiota bacterium]|jgi:ABC-type glycerol-3-phosphate transport system permease component